MFNELIAIHSMISEYDANLENLMEAFNPRWTEIRVRKKHSLPLDKHSFRASSAMFIGKPSLLCCVDSTGFRNDLWEYFPIYLEEVDESKYALDQWITLARKGGTGELDRKLQWLFEMPSLALTEGVESVTDWPPKEDSKEISFSFYNGLEVKDPKGRGSLRITASDQPDFTFTLRLMV